MSLLFEQKMDVTNIGILNSNVSIDNEIIYSERTIIVEICSYIIAALGILTNILTRVVLSSDIKLRRKPINIFIIHQVRPQKYI